MNVQSHEKGLVSMGGALIAHWKEVGTPALLKEALTLGGERTTMTRTWQVSVLGLAISLAIAFYMLVTEGHAAFNTNSWGVTWGLPISTYVFFVLTSTGLTFLASLAMIFGFDEFYPVAKRCVWLALATLVAGFATLALELGHPLRMLWAVPTGLQYRSPMFWMGVFYTLYLLLLFLKFVKIHGGDWDSRASRYLGISSFVSVVIAHSTLGLLFGMMAMRPMWYDGMLAVYFLITAAMSGAAFAVFFTYLAYGFSQEKMPEKLRALASGSALPNMFATMIGITILATVSRTITGLWSNMDGLEVYQLLVRSPMYHLEFWAGLVVPFILMLSPTLQRQAKMQILSAALVMASLFMGRLEFVVSGQLVPMFKGSALGFFEYTPSMTEWMLALVGIFITFALYAFGEKLLHLSAQPAKA